MSWKGGERERTKETESRDEWLAPDKLQHLLACLLITLLVSATLSRTRYLFLRRWSVTLGSVTALAAGAAKEAGDEIGLWESAGGSVKDAIADLLGVLIASFYLSLLGKYFPIRDRVDRDRGISMV